MNNCESAISCGDLADLFDGVSCDYEIELSTTSTLQDADSMDVIDNKLDENIDSGIMKVGSYPDTCTNNFYIAHHQVSAIIAGASKAS
jgi:hypothetical protein